MAREPGPLKGFSSIPKACRAHPHFETSGQTIAQIETHDKPEACPIPYTSDKLEASPSPRSGGMTLARPFKAGYGCDARARRVATIDKLEACPSTAAASRVQVPTED